MLPLAFNYKHFIVLAGGAAHRLCTLKLSLPLFDQLSGFPKVFRLVTLAPAGQRVCGVSRFFDKQPKAHQTVVDGCFGLCLFLRSTSASLLVFSRASSALRLSSAVPWHAFFRSTHVTSWSVRQSLTPSESRFQMRPTIGELP